MSATGPTAACSSSIRTTCGRSAAFAVGEHPNQIAAAPEGRPAVRRLRLEQLRLGDRHASAASSPRRSTRASSRKAPEGSTPDALAVAPDGETLYVANADNNCVAVVDIAEPGREPGQGLHPDRLVSDRRGRHARRQAAAGRRRQGQPDAGRTSRARSGSKRSARRPTGEGGYRRIAVPVHRHDALRRALDRADPRRQAARSLHRPGLSQLPLLRQAADRRPLRRARRRSRPRSATRRRSSTSSTSSRRTAPTTRSSATSPQGNGDPIAGDVRRGGHAEPSQAGRASSCCSTTSTATATSRPTAIPGRTMAYNTDYIARNWALTYSRRAGHRRRRRGRPAEGPVGLHLGRLRAARPDLPQLRRIRRRVSQPDGTLRMEGRVPGPGRPHLPRLRHPQGSRPARSATPTTSRSSSKSSASSRRTATCRGSSS